METIQDLLDAEVALANAGKRDCEERKQLLTLIKLRRDESQRPDCFGDDDCSTYLLSICPWRNECGGNY